MFVSKKLGRFIYVAMCALILSAGSLLAQNMTVTGKVVDKNNEPIIGAYVVVMGTTVGTSTGVDGSYVINAPANGTLQFTCIGYKTQEVLIAGRNNIPVILAEDAELLENAVVVGYGTQKLANLTGSVATIDAGKALDSRPIADVGRGLQGMAPGLNVRITSSEVGAEPIMRIRGQFASMQGSAAPLILLDNVEIDSIQLLNPDDIESISVLKDAASASIYGAKAAFGVVLITSKKGAREKDQVHVTYSGNMAFQNLAERLAIAGVNGMHYTVQAFERTGGTVAGYPWYVSRESWQAAVEWDKQFGSTIGADDPVVYGRDYYYDGTRVYGIRTYNPTDYLIRKNAPTMTHSVSVAGNKGRTDYNLSTSFLDQQGQTKHAKHDDYQRWNLNARVSTQINNWLNVRAGLMFSKTQKRMAYNTAIGNADYWYYLYRWSPMQTIALEDSNGYSLRSPAQEARDANTAIFTTLYTSGNVGTTITPVKNWNINFDYTYAGTDSDSYRPGTRFTAGDTWSTPTPIGGTVKNYWNAFNGMGEMIPDLAFVPIQITSNGSGIDHVQVSYGLTQRRTINATTDYTLDLAGDHHFKFMLGMNRVDYRYKDFWTRKTNLLDITNPQIALATGTITNGGDDTWSSTLGFFGRLNYNYKERYLLEANIRYDGSSKFPKHLKWMWFPSVSAGWRVTEEPWMEGAKDVLSAMKLRASWGTIGDQSVAGSMYIPTMSSTLSTWIHDGARDTYFNTAGAVASDITWQMIETIDFGADLSFFNSLNITFDWFRRKTNGMIVPGPGVGYAYGTTAPQGNFGSLHTDGWELSVNYGHMFDNGFSVSATATLADALTKISKYGATQSIDDWYVGKTYGEIWGYRVDRLYQNSDFEWQNGSLVRVEANDPSNPANYQYAHYKMTDSSAPLQGRFNASSSVMFGPGDVKYRDLDGDGIITDGTRLINDHGDLDIIGNTTPRYEYSFRLDLAWKGIDFSMFWQGIGKRDMWGSSSLTLPGFNSSDGAMAAAFADNFWYEEFKDGSLVDSHYDAFYPRAYNMGNGTSGFNLLTNDRYLLNMAYLRLKNVTLGYSLPMNLIRKINMQKARIYVSLENFLTFDHLKGMPVDPEVVAGVSSLLSSGYNASRAAVGAPAMRTASFGLQLSF